MQDGEIAKTDDPFWLLNKPGKVEAINDTDHAVSSSGAHDGPDCRIIHHLLEIICPFLIGSTERKIFFADGIANLYFESPAFHLHHGRLDLFKVNMTGRRSDPNQVTGFQVFGDECWSCDFLPVKTKKRNSSSKRQHRRKKTFAVHELKLSEFRPFWHCWCFRYFC